MAITGSRFQQSVAAVAFRLVFYGSFLSFGAAAKAEVILDAIVQAGAKIDLALRTDPSYWAQIRRFHSNNDRIKLTGLCVNTKTNEPVMPDEATFSTFAENRKIWCKTVRPSKFEPAGWINIRVLKLHAPGG